MAQQIHVFVVDHRDTFLRLMQSILKTAGYEATVCHAGDEAHQLISKLQPDVIVVDTWLQERDEGWELVQTLRLDEHTRHIPIVLASSDAERLQERASEIRAMRNVLLVPKPFDPETLLHAISRVTNPNNLWDSEAQAALDAPD